MAKNNIVLIGMPGVGKSTVGVILAKESGYQFLDADLLIQQQEGRLLREILAEKGTEGFIEVENRVNAGICAEHTIIATGGSVVYGREAMQHLHEIGTVVYLEVSFETIQMRLEDIKGRGVVLRNGQTLKNLYEERVPLYRKYADIVISEENLNIEQTVQKLLDFIQHPALYAGCVRSY
jgi:shikimate kinase